MPTRTRAGASARKVARRRAPPRPKTKPRKQAKPRKVPRKTAARAQTRMTPYGPITMLPGRPLGYTPALKANARYRYEETPESPYSIAVDLGMHHVSLKRLAARDGWVRRNPPQQRDITDVMRLAAAAEALLASSAHSRPGSGSGVNSSGNPEHAATAAPEILGPRFRGDERSDEAPDTSAIDRLEAAVLKELSAVERMRAAHGAAPLRPLEAQVTARTLSTLTETLSKLRRLRLGSAPQSGSTEDDDIPDIDEFRNELARRIDAFVASRTEPRDAHGDAGVAVDAP